MASLTLLRPTLFALGRRSLSTTAALSGTAVLAAALLHRPLTRPLLCDASPVASSPADWSLRGYASDAKVPIFKDGKVNPKAYRQISAGSISGLIVGLALSTFSKPLTLLIGLMVFGVQALENRGIHIVPWQTMQSWVKGINLRSAFQDNAAFKLSFGLTCAMAAFGSF